MLLIDRSRFSSRVLCHLLWVASTNIREPARISCSTARTLRRATSARQGAEVLPKYSSVARLPMPWLPGYLHLSIGRVPSVCVQSGATTTHGMPQRLPDTITQVNDTEEQVGAVAPGQRAAGAPQSRRCSCHQKRLIEQAVRLASEIALGHTHSACSGYGESTTAVRSAVMVTSVTSLHSWVPVACRWARMAQVRSGRPNW